MADFRINEATGKLEEALDDQDFILLTTYNDHEDIDKMIGTIPEVFDEDRACDVVGRLQESLGKWLRENKTIVIRKVELQ